jgi:hypothetical protein
MRAPGRRSPASAVSGRAKHDRRSAADLAVLVPGQSVQRLRPPAELTEAERLIFLDILGTAEAAKFEPSDLPLPPAYVRAIGRERTASAHCAQTAMSPLMVNRARGLAPRNGRTAASENPAIAT